MNAPRRLLAWLWAALWVRWRLLAVRTGGVLGGRPAAAGSGWYLSPAEIPTEGVDYELVELPPELAARLDAARVELVDHARDTATRRVRRRRVRRRRTASLATASLLTLAVLGGGAVALVAGTTGVPAVDRLLGIYEAGLDKPGAADRPGPSGRDLQPAPSSESTTIEVPLDGGKRRIVSTSYVAAGEGTGVCSVLATPSGSDAGDVACVPPARLAAALERGDGQVLAVTEGAAEVVLRGFVGGDVERLEGVGPTGPLDVTLGEVWTPDLPGIDSLRPFVAVEADVHDRLVSAADYTLQAVTDDGSRRRIAP